MALPSSGPISGSQIWEEVNGSTTDPPPQLSLGGMIASSSLSNTDPDAYSDFYGYGSLISFYLTVAGTLQKPACNQTCDNTAYHDGGSLLPTTGDTIYTNASGTVAKPNGTYGVSGTSGANPATTITVNGGSGNVSQVGTCK